MTYQNHIKHYQLDAEQHNYFYLDKFMQQEWRRRYETIFSLLTIKPGMKFLDIGSGSGFTFPFIHEKTCQYIPLDLSHGNLNRIKIEQKGLITPVNADIYNLPFKENSVDIILLSEVLEHLEDPKTALGSIYHVLKPEGQFVITVPCNEKINYHLCIHCNKPTPTNAHLHSFDMEKLSQHLTESSLKPIRIMKRLNKPFNRLHGNLLLKWLPYSLWKIQDTLLNKVIDKATSLVILTKK